MSDGKEVRVYTHLSSDPMVKASDHHTIVAELRAEVERYQLLTGHLKGTLEGILVFADDADMRREFARRALEKLAAIERAEGEKEHE